jgi:hypothetical protein
MSQFVRESVKGRVTLRSRAWNSDKRGQHQRQHGAEHNQRTHYTRQGYMKLMQEHQNYINLSLHKHITYRRAILVACKVADEDPTKRLQMRCTSRERFWSQMILEWVVESGAMVDEEEE